MSVSRRLRFEVLRRDNHTCRYCGRTAPDVAIQVDHVVPVALGGDDDPSNLTAACIDCNGGKTSVSASDPLIAQVTEDDLRWGAAIRYAAEKFEIEVEHLQVEIRRFEAAWRRWTFIGKPAPVPHVWEQSIRTFLAAGLTGEILDHLVGVTMGRNNVPSHERWRYFCGCAWKTVRELRDEARTVLDEGDSGLEPCPCCGRQRPQDAEWTDPTGQTWVLCQPCAKMMGTGDQLESAAS